MYLSELGLSIRPRPFVPITASYLEIPEEIIDISIFFSSYKERFTAWDQNRHFVRPLK